MFDAVHKDETIGFSQTRAPKRPKTSETVDQTPSDDHSPEQGSPSPPTGDELAILMSPSRNFEMESLCYFFSNYVNIPRDPSTNIFIEHILPLYLSASPESALSQATHAVAMNITQMWMSRFVDSFVSREPYWRAVRLLKSALQDTIQCRTDETLATVFLLDFYESLNQRFTHFIDTGTHQQGAVALLRHRGKDNFKTALSQRLFNAMRGRHINYCLVSGQRVALDQDLLAEDTAILPSAKLDLLNAELADLNVLARSGPEAYNLGLAGFYHIVLQKALVLEKKFQAWSESLPKSWQPMAVPVSDLHPSIRAAGVYEDKCEVYSSLGVSHVHNCARGSHIGVLRLVALCIRGLEDLGISVDPDIEPYIIAETQNVTDRFCAAMPFHLGNRTALTLPHEHREYPRVPAELAQLANFVDPFGNKVEMTMEDHIRAAAAVGGWFIMTPMASFLKVPALRSENVKPGPLIGKLRKGQLDWVRSQIARIQKIYILPTRMICDDSKKQPSVGRGWGNNVFAGPAFGVENFPG